jgi:hypothetical protein
MITALLAMLIGTSVSGYLLTTDAWWGSKRHAVWAGKSRRRLGPMR